MQIKKINSDKKSISFLALVTCLGGCGDISSDNSLNASKVLAKVNGDEISIRQFDAELNRAHLGSDVSDSIKDELLSKMIDRQLLVQEASKINLDRAPEVLEAVNTAKAQIYAQAYLTNRISKLTSPTDEDVTKYIYEHPEICAHRKVFSTKDVVFNYDPARIDFESIQSSVTNIESLLATLDSNNIQYNIISGNLSLDTLPSHWVEKLKVVKIGDLLFAHDNRRVIVKSISSISEKPMSDEEAQGYAKRALFEDKKAKLISNEVTRLRRLSKIQILDSEMALTNASLPNVGDNHLIEPLSKP